MTSLSIKSASINETIPSITRQEAIDRMRNFPWKSELSILEHSPLIEFPEFIFESNSLGRLTITLYENAYYEIVHEKENKIGYADSFADEVNESDSVEPADMIATYFDGDLHEHIKMEVKEAVAEKKETYVFEVKTGTLFRFLLIPIIFFGVSIYLFIKSSVVKPSFDNQFLFILFPILLLISQLPRIWFVWRYYQHDRYRQLTIDQRKQEIKIVTQDQTITFKTKDIASCRIDQGKSSLSVLHLRLKNEKQYSITCILINPYEFCSLVRLNYERGDVLFPIIQKGE
jgi:ATP-dependent Zn protease